MLVTITNNNYQTLAYPPVYAENTVASLVKIFVFMFKSGHVLYTTVPIFRRNQAVNPRSTVSEVRKNPFLTGFRVSRVSVMWVKLLIIESFRR